MQNWKCSNCGYVVQYPTPPEKCPFCEEICTFVDNNCYTPDCGIIDPDYTEDPDKDHKHR